MRDRNPNLPSFFYMRKRTVGTCSLKQGLQHTVRGDLDRVNARAGSSRKIGGAESGHLRVDSFVVFWGIRFFKTNFLNFYFNFFFERKKEVASNVICFIIFGFSWN